MDRVTWRKAVPPLAAGTAFLLVFGPGLAELVRDWIQVPEYRHGFLLLAVAAYLAFDRRPEGPPEPDRRLGAVVVAGGVGLFLVASAAAEHFSMRLAALVAGAGLVLFYRGRGQLRAWWLPFTLMVFAIPLPEVVLSSLTLPLQLFASRAAVDLLQFRHVPAAVAGNIIQLPGQELFVAEACSGLRSISALFGLAVLVGGTWIDGPGGRVALLAVALPAAILANVLRIFVTGYLVYFVGAGAARGALHESAGMAAFAGALAAVVLTAALLRGRERRLQGA